MIVIKEDGKIKSIHIAPDSDNIDLMAKMNRLPKKLVEVIKKLKDEKNG